MDDEEQHQGQTRVPAPIAGAEVPFTPGDLIALF
jgi:hypothetical protein